MKDNRTYYGWNMVIVAADDNYPYLGWQVNSNSYIWYIAGYYPQFYNQTNGTGLDGNFSINVNNTNGTVILNIDGTTVQATSTGNHYHAHHTFSSGGTYPYYWSSYGNGTNENYGVSETSNYVIVLNNNEEIIKENSINSLVTTIKYLGLLFFAIILVIIILIMNYSVTGEGYELLESDLVGNILKGVMFILIAVLIITVIVGLI
jgi:hypothetical protein